MIDAEQIANWTADPPSIDDMGNVTFVAGGHRVTVRRDDLPGLILFLTAALKAGRHGCSKAR